MPGTYELIQSYTLPSSQANYTFTGISQSYTDLVFTMSGSCTLSEGALLIQVGNGSIDTGSNYSYGYIYSAGSSVGRDYQPTTTSGSVGRVDTTNGAGLVHINNYSGTNGFKTILSHGVNGAVGLMQLQQSTWRNTSAINQIRVFPEQGGSLNTGYKLTLYGILKA